jgi:hypothetical protein
MHDPGLSKNHASVGSGWETNDFAVLDEASEEDNGKLGMFFHKQEE